jgi:D-3-phosphoglycerate dehydrogenase
MVYMPKVVFFENINGDVSPLVNRNVEIELVNNVPDSDFLANTLKVADAILVKETQLTKEILSFAKQTYLIASIGGADNVNTDIARDLGIPVFVSDNEGEIIKSMSDFIFLGNTHGAINFPDVVNRPLTDDTIRILHIHKNIPGVMKELNLIFSYYNINIESQYLNTHETIGYVATDIVKGTFDDDVLDSLKSVKGTRRIRIIE